MKKALVITYYWPPSGGSGVQRWLKFVKYFRDFGIEPIVYTVKNPNYPIEDKSLIEEIPKGIEILKQPIWEPISFIKILGLKKTTSAGFLNPNPSFFGKLAHYIRANYFIPDARKMWVKPSVRYLKEYINSHKIDVIITTGPPHSTHLIGLKLKKLLAVKWIADFRDPWTEIDYFHQLPFTKTTIKKHYYLESKVLKNADVVLVVGDTMKEKYKKFNKNVVTITNGFDEVGTIKDLTLDSKFTITHVGLMNADRNPKILWQVLSEISSENTNFKADFELKLIGKVAPSIIDEISNFDLTSKVKIINYVPYNEVVNYQKKSQVLLLIVNNVPSARGIVTGKIFEYLVAKRPILAIAPEQGDLAEIILKTNSGEVIDFTNALKLKKTILDLYSKYKEKRLIVATKNIEQFHRRELTKKVSEIIKTITE